VPTALLGPGDLQSLRPYPQFSNVQILGSDVGRSNYNGVNVGINKRYSYGLQFKFNYTYSKFLDNVASRGELGAPQNTAYEAAFMNYYNQANDWGLSGNDIRHRIIFSPVYELPFGQGKLFNLSSSFLNRLIGGWSVSSILEWHTGTPLSPFELTNNTNSYSDGVRPNVVGNPSLPGNRTQAQQVAAWFNVNAFAAPAPYTFGNAGRTFGAGPGFFSVDGAILKDVAVERFTVQFRLEAINLTNHANFANPNVLQGAGTFGQITSLAPGLSARVVQIGLHVKF
jgi:hypothetical protein